MLKASEQEGSVVYSFKGKWLEPITSGRVKVFFRKRVPLSRPRRVYLYVCAPTSAIVGWAEVVDLKRISSTDALNMASDGAIDIHELKKYLENTDSVGVIRIGFPNLFSSAITAAEVCSIFNFHPPQNFFQISSDDASKLDELRK